jgi:hypothetical protein
MKRILYCVLTAVAGLLIAPPAAHADPAWTSPDNLYSVQWRFLPVDVPSIDLPADPGSATGKATVTVGRDGFYDDNSSVVAANIKLFSTGTKAHPSLLNVGGRFKLVADVFDRAMGPGALPQSVTFNVNLGVETNPITHAGSRFGSGFADLNIQITPTTAQVLHFSSGDTITLQLDPFSRVDAASASGQGAITGLATFSSPGVIQKVPEPASLLLGAFGLSMAGGFTWWRRRQPASR